MFLFLTACFFEVLVRIEIGVANLHAGKFCNTAFSGVWCFYITLWLVDKNIYTFICKKLMCLWFKGKPHGNRFSEQRVPDYFDKSLHSAQSNILTGITIHKYYLFILCKTKISASFQSCLRSGSYADSCTDA